MEKKIKELEGCEREIEITITNSELQPHFDKAYLDAQSKINLKGFRKGKVPIKVIKQYYGRQIEAEALQDISSDVFNQVVAEEKLQVVGQPKLKKVDDLDDGVSFTIIYEVIPEFELAEYRGLSIDEPVHAVDDDEIDKTIDQILFNSGRFEPADEITDEKTLVEIKLRETDYETNLPIISAKPLETKVMLTDKNIDPVLREKFFNKAKGDSFLHQPKESDPHAPDKVFRIEITDIFKIIPAEFSNEFVEKYSQGKFNSCEEFHDEIGFQIQEEWDQKSRVEMENQIVNHLVGASRFEVPEGIVWGVIKAMADDIKKRYENTPDAAKLSIENMAEGLRPLAERTVRWEIIRNKIIDKESLKVEDHDIEHLVDYEAARLHSDKESIRQAILQNKNITGNILSKKAMDFILDFAITNEIPFEEYDDRFGGRHDHEHEHFHEHDD